MLYYSITTIAIAVIEAMLVIGVTFLQTRMAFNQDSTCFLFSNAKDSITNFIIVAATNAAIIAITTAITVLTSCFGMIVDTDCRYLALPILRVSFFRYCSAID